MPYVHPSAIIIGRVELGEGSSVWPCAVLRADNDIIVIGDESNVQDGTVIHVDPGFPCHIGRRVTIGHRAVVHGATVEDECLIGMGAILLNGCVIGTGSVVGAGAVVREGMIVPPNSVVLGIPAKVTKQVDAQTRERILSGAAAYVKIQERYARGEF